MKIDHVKQHYNDDLSPEPRKKIDSGPAQLHMSNVGWPIRARLFHQANTLDDTLASGGNFFDKFEDDRYYDRFEDA
jgi:hypothetical protein